MERAPPADVEGAVGPRVGDVDVCMANHHGSASSSTDAWLNAITPEVCVVSVGANGFGHPTAAAMGRLHTHGVQTYWTNLGDDTGAVPDPTFDRVVGNVFITTNGAAYNVNGDSYPTD
jgi:hypothetical protein